MLKQSDVIVTRDRIHGTWECAAIVNGARVSRVYYFYTKREAVRRFTREVKAISKVARMEHERQYQPKTGIKCSCRRGVERDNCPQCEGTGMRIDFNAIHARRNNG